MHNLRGHNYVNRYFTLSRQSSPFVCRIPEIRFDSVVLQSTRCGIANPPPPPTPETNDHFAPWRKIPSLPPSISLSPSTYNRPDFYIWSTFVSDSRKWPANGTGPTGSPRLSRRPDKHFRDKTLGRLVTIRVEREREREPPPRLCIYRVRCTRDRSPSDLSPLKILVRSGEKLSCL